MKTYLTAVVLAGAMATASASATDLPTSDAARGGQDVPEAIRKAQEQPKPTGKAPSPQEAVKKDDAELRSWVTERLWGTTLGRMYSDYLFSNNTPDDNLRKVHRIVERLFGNVFLSMNRVSGIQLMTEDLFNSGRVTPVINDRIGLILLNISLKRHALEVEAARQVNWQLPGIAFVGFLLGSDVVRSTAGTFVSALKSNLLWVIFRHGRAEAMAGRQAVRHFDWRQLLSSERFFANYSTPRAVAGGFGAFFFYTPFYFQAVSGTSESASPAQKTIIYGVQQLIDLSNL